jgi:hypothetical protein
MKRMNPCVAKLQGIYIRNLLYPCNLRNLRLNLFSVFGFRNRLALQARNLLLWFVVYKRS